MMVLGGTSGIGKGIYVQNFAVTCRDQRCFAYALPVQTQPMKPWCSCRCQLRVSAAEVLCAMVRDVAFSKHRRMASWIWASVWASIAASVHNKLNVLQLGLRIPVYWKKTQRILLNQKMNMIPLDFQVYKYIYIIFFQTNPARSKRRDLPWLANKLQWLHQEPPIWIVEVLPEQLRPFVSAPLTDSVLSWTKKGAVSAVSRINLNGFCPKMEDVSNILFDMFPYGNNLYN